MIQTTKGKDNIMTTKKQRQGITTTALLSQCTGVMKIDNDGYYVGYYTRKELMESMLAEGHDAKLVDYYVFSMKECRGQHPGVVSRH
jgi:hypothetical protein